MKKSANLFFSIAYLALAIPMFYMPSQGFFLGSFGVEYKHLLGICIIFLSLIHFLISADLRSAIRCGKDAVVMARPYLWCLGYSLIFWVVTMAGFRVMTKGTFLVAYQIIAIFAAAGTLYMFGSKGIYLMMTALTVALLLLCAEQVRMVGLGSFVREYIGNITSFTANSGSTMRAFEKLGHCYATGFCLVYFLMTAKESKKNVIWAVISFFLFFLGMKRSVSLGTVGALVFALLISRIKRPKKWVLPIALAGIVLVTLYIVWVYYGLFDWLETIGISTSGRNWLYGQIREYYYFSPAYFGKGAGFVATAFSNGAFDVSGYGFSIGDIHNEYLRQYIEYGFLGFLVWAWLYTADRVKYFFHKGLDPVENRHGVIAFALVMVNCIMFMTENSQYYFYTTMVMAMFIMGYQYEHFVEQTKLPGDET